MQAEVTVKLLEREQDCEGSDILKTSLQLRANVTQFDVFKRIMQTLKEFEAEFVPEAEPIKEPT